MHQIILTKQIHLSDYERKPLLTTQLLTASGGERQAMSEHDAEDAVVSREPELRQLSENIDKATNTWINATLQLESAFRKYNSAQTALGNAVDTIGGKVDTINTHIDKVMENAPTKLQVSVRVRDEDWQKIQEMHTKQQQWMTAAMQKHIRQVNDMFYEERKRVQERYKEYDGTYLGHYVQYIFWFFFTIGLFMFGLGIFLMLDSHYHWTK